MHLVMLETNGNQRFVFSSPRQRENIGASYLLTRLTEWTQHEIDDAGLREGLNGYQWVSQASGKVILTLADEDSARGLIGAVTRRALAKAPGIDVSGVFHHMATSYITAEDLEQVHVTAARYGVSRPPAEARFQRVPFLRLARDSSLPACPTAPELDEPGLPADRSLPSRVKRSVSVKARNDLVALAESDARLAALVTRFPHHLEELEDHLGDLASRFDFDAGSVGRPDVEAVTGTGAGGGDFPGGPQKARSALPRPP